MPSFAVAHASWFYLQFWLQPERKRLLHVLSLSCLEAEASTGRVYLQRCNDTAATQQWHWKHVNRTHLDELNEHVNKLKITSFVRHTSLLWKFLAATAVMLLLVLCHLVPAVSKRSLLGHYFIYLRKRLSNGKLM